MNVQEVWGPCGPQFLSGGPSCFLTSSRTVGAEAAGPTHKTSNSRTHESVFACSV